jgi:DNA-binding transcriptional LysR family regulator
MEWSDLQLVLAICRAGTLSGAARMLGVNHSTVYRRINAIEAGIDVRLFERFPHGYVMTEAGEAVKASAERVEAEILGLSRALIGKDLRLQGKLRVTAPEGVGLKLLLPHLTHFCRQHPEIEMDLIVTNSTLRLSLREADVAVRVTSNPPDTSFGRRICDFRFTMYASAEYLQRYPDTGPEAHLWALWEDSTNWLPAYVQAMGDHVLRNIVFRSNSTLAAIGAARDGVGVTLLPCFLGDRDPGLVRVIEPPEDLTLQLWILTHSDLRHTARVRTLMRFITESLLAQKDSIEGKLRADPGARSGSD